MTQKSKQLALNVIGVIICWAAMVLIGLSACYVKEQNIYNVPVDQNSTQE